MLQVDDGTSIFHLVFTKVAHGINLAVSFPPEYDPPIRAQLEQLASRHGVMARSPGCLIVNLSRFRDNFDWWVDRAHQLQIVAEFTKGCEDDINIEITQASDILVVAVQSKYPEDVAFSTLLNTNLASLIPNEDDNHVGMRRPSIIDG